MSGTVAVVDCETTGVDPDDCAVVEVASVTLDLASGKIVRAETSLCDPRLSEGSASPSGRIVPPEASAVHHIVDEDLDGQPSPETVAELMLAPHRLAFAHNAAFDRSFLGGSAPHLKWGCTLRLARRAFPDLPSHSNQSLRYRLLDDSRGACAIREEWFRDRVDFLLSGAALLPHRALADATVTARLLPIIASRLSDQPLADCAADLAELSWGPILLPFLTFGKYARNGPVPWRRVPRDYLEWILRQSDWDDPDVPHTAAAALRGEFAE